MRSIGFIICTVFVLTTVPHAQDRLLTLGLHGTSWNGHPTQALIETNVAGTTIGPAVAVAVLPEHGFRSHQLVAMAGGRYVAWVAQTASGPSYYDCRAFVAVLDRRRGTTQVVPEIQLPCGVATLVADPRRPRVFLHTWATTGGWPGVIASIDATLVVQPIIVSNRLGTAFAYAADADQLIVTELAAFGDPSLYVAVFSASTGERIRAFPARDARNLDTARMQVTSDGRRVFLWTAWGALLPFEQQIRQFDVISGMETAASRPVFPGIGVIGDTFVVDQERNLVLTPHLNMEPPFAYQLLAFEATTLRFVGEAQLPGYSGGSTFQPIIGRGAAAAYLLIGRLDPLSGGCGAWLGAFDATGALRARGDVLRLAGVVPPRSPGACATASILLSRPLAPSNLSAAIVGRRVTLTWTNPGDTSEFELEAGAAPGRRDLSTRVGLVTEFSVDDVPSGIYYVRVRAVNEIGTSPFSDELRIVVP